MESVLIIDDDVELCRMLDDYLTPHGISLTMRHHAAEGLEALQQGSFDLILLDVMLPGMDGFAVLRKVREWSDVGVLLLTARGEDCDRIMGFECGADDYLPKPFNPRELLARIRAIICRGIRNLQKAKTHALASRSLVVDGVSMDFGTRRVSSNGKQLDLTDVEFELLAAFLEAPGQILTRGGLMERVFERQFNPDDRSLDMCVSRLRRKLDSIDPTNSRIRTVRSAGYLFSTRRTD